MKTRIKEIRQSLNMTKEELSKKTKISTKQIYRIENEEINPRIDTLKSIATALNTTVGYLLNENTT